MHGAPSATALVNSLPVRVTNPMEVEPPSDVTGPRRRRGLPPLEGRCLPRWRRRPSGRTGMSGPPAAARHGGRRHPRGRIRSTRPGGEDSEFFYLVVVRFLPKLICREEKMAASARAGEWATSLATACSLLSRFVRQNGAAAAELGKILFLSSFSCDICGENLDVSQDASRLVFDLL
ncbi:hypothetical protein BRADI_1g39920v3 [Brachypodium distachyon]|uniref:Uncharacterized protein n=1 Tax=Brachypodium distachyon TaxID=15368 RepID=A0A0Q3NLD9_BRADI|nr:hypothetical protein BRADI_1g39920v3 [Brachypodium distachyon]